MNADGFSLPGRMVLRVSGRIDLTGAGQAWIVESGELALFAIPMDPDGRPGTRRHLMTAVPGETLFGFDPAPEQPTIAGIGLDEVVLVPAPGEDQPEQAYDAWIDRWREALGVSDGSADHDEPPASQDQEQPEEVVEEPPPAAAETFDRVATQAAVLEAVGTLLGNEERRALELVAERAEQAREVAREAVGRLTSLLETGAEESPPRGSPLFVAAWLVGRKAGIKLRAVAGWRLAQGDGEDVEAIARASQVRTRHVVLEGRWWEHDGGPLIGFTTEGRPLALLPTPRGGYESIDPETNERRPVTDELDRELDPVAWMFFRPLPDDSHRGFALLKFALSGRGRDLATMGLTALCATLLGMVTPVATALLVDQAIPDADRRLLLDLAIALLAAAAGMAVFRVAQGFVMMRIETAAEVATQAAVWDRLLKLRLSFFRKYPAGDLQSRVSAVSQIRDYLGGTTLSTLFSSVVLLLNLGLLFYYSPSLTLVAVAVTVVTAAFTAASGILILRWERPILELRGRFFGLMVQLINGIPKLRVAAAEPRAFARWAEDYSRLLGLELRQRRVQDAIEAVNLGVESVSTIVLFAFAASLALPGAGGAQQLSTGAFLAFLAAYGMFSGALGNLSNTITDVMVIAILRERAEPILTAEPEVQEQKADPGRLSGRIDVRHVSFRYGTEGANTLDDVSIEIGARQFVALVGPSGSGKSTLFRLLLGFETPASGTILFDGQDLSGLDVDGLRRQMGVVLQGGRISAGSIFENVVSGTRATLDDAWQAARDTGFAQDVETMPMGMHTVVSEGGTNLSGGQRQRMLLARALVHHPRILLLDEATSALDNRTQAIVSESLERLSVTRVVVAHRLSTIRHADRIYVIEAGRVVQSGTFEELAAVKGAFANLIARQLT